jgi:hypothetical protein
LTPVSPGIGAPFEPPPPAIDVGAVGRFEAAIVDAEVVALAVAVELDWVMGSVVVKLVVEVTVLLCLFESKVMKVDTEKDVTTVWEGVLVELLLVADDWVDDWGE